ncbi:hypothetical protein K227x_28480 [Rubripirellula lacrimiformis]|uniref:Uncharacterized protein n=1 Tax=Rubripirellula lacrimiformis TaxID=1930273 RepID=A0A517NBF4_9BACT|nr:NfeD family protein [Rubripirellula lacrimiformis]QDT04457.1 hypothetical protein K227x_28480 [Rubripirellula lacrimiformis]
MKSTKRESLVFPSDNVLTHMLNQAMSREIMYTFLTCQRALSRRFLGPMAGCCFLAMILVASMASAQTAGDDKPKGDSSPNSGNPAAQAADATPNAAANPVKVGQLVDVSIPITSQSAAALVDRLKAIADSTASGQRTTVVLRFRGDDGGTEDAAESDETVFEDALRVARALTSTELRQVRVVAWVDGVVAGHTVLPILASDLLLVSPGAELVNASQGERADLTTITIVYEKIAAQRGLFPAAVVQSLVDPSIELARVSKAGGQQSFAAGSELQQLRQSGELVSEDIYSTAGVPLRLSSKQLRDARIAASVVQSADQAAERLDLAKLESSDVNQASGEAVGVLLEVTGSIATSRTRRWQSNLDSTLGKQDINTWMISIDSIGGNLDDSATLASWFATPPQPLRSVVGYVRGEARGDSALIAIACKPLLMKPDSRLGGPGAETISPDAVLRYDELIEQVASATNRPAALIRGLLDPELVVYRYEHVRTGRIRYATEDDLVSGVEDPEAERAKWQQGPRVELADGLTAAEAVSLGLADGESESLEAASRKAGLAATPPPVADRGLVRLVERLGRNQTLSFLLLFVGFAALSAEANAPGLSVPGFIALVCFGLFFWIKFLSGTAEWLELVALVLGLTCIAIELFVVPGFGVFGIGGLALTVLGVVLMSQTFVVPQSVYQLNLFSRGVWLALGGAAGMAGGFVAMRFLLPHVPILNGLVMEAPDELAISEAEKLGDFSYLLGQHGHATTPLRPAGKARFGDEIVPVISDGTSAPVGAPVRVLSVQATKVVVEIVES